MTQRQENITGADLTGASGATNRTYDLAYDNPQGSSLIIIVDNSPWQLGVNYTYGSGTITFTSAVWNDSEISLYYTTSVLGAIDTTYYCTPDDVKRVMRLSQSFGDSTNPTELEVYAFIEDSMTEIDRLTRHAWRELTSDYEYFDVPKNFVYEYGVGLRLKLQHRIIKTFDSGEGDKLEVWNGSEWENWLTAKTEGRANDYWLDEEEGTVFLLQRYWFHRKRAIRIKYRYGEDSIPKDIRKACSYMVAADILDSDDYSSSVNETAETSNTTHQDRIVRWDKKAAEILDKYKEFFTF